MSKKILELHYGSVTIENDYGFRMKIVGEDSDCAAISLSPDEAEQIARALLAFAEIEKP